MDPEFTPEIWTVKN